MPFNGPSRDTCNYGLITGLWSNDGVESGA